MSTYVFDLDGTLADCTHRLHYIQGEEKNWDAFFLSCSKDTPIPHMIEVCDALFNAGHDIVIVSGRSDLVREETENWLRLHSISYDHLYMRSHGDHRPDDVVKADLFKAMQLEGVECPVMAFDDRKRVVDFWRSVHIPCAQVAEGDF